VRPCGRRIHVGAHSMGNLVLESFVGAVNQSLPVKFPLFREILLLRADVDWDALETGKPLASLHQYADRTHASPPVRWSWTCRG